MKKKILGFFTLFLFTFSTVSAQETVKVMFYNLLNYPLENAVPNRINDLAYILNDYKPDLFLVCELNNISGAIDVFNTTKTAIHSNFEMATYVSNTSDDTFGDQNDLQNLLYYDSTKFSLQEEIIVPTYLRDFNVYRLQLNTIDQATNPIELYVIVCHLKASSGTANAQKRFEMVLDLETYLDTLPADTNVLLGGDFNVFSQSTRTQTGMGGTTGGFDDRFDFILTSEDMMSSANLTYVPESYRVYGNNGLTSCWNKAINSSECETTGSQFSYTLRNHLHNFSDHLPVTLSLETDATFLSVEDFDISSRTISLETTIINHSLIVNVNTSTLQNERLNIYNSLGQPVKTMQMNADAKQYFNVSDLENGLYFLSVTPINANPLKFIISN